MGVHSGVDAPYGAVMILALLLVLCLSVPPIDGPVVAEFHRSDGYAGHWGVDISARPGSDVRAPGPGVVTFAGRVAGMRSVTIRTDDGLRVSLSYLSSVDVAAGQRVNAGAVVGRSGFAHGEPALHVSARVGDAYVDPIAFLHCRPGTIRLLIDR